MDINSNQQKRYFKCTQWLVRYLVLSFVIVILTSCSYYNIFPTTPPEIIESGEFKLDFHIASIEYQIKRAKDSVVTPNIRFAINWPVVYEHRDCEIYPDSEYLQLSLSYLEKKYENTNLTLVADSIYFQKDSVSKLIEFSGWEQSVVELGPKARRLDIMPLIVAKDYNGEFKIQLILSVYNKNDSVLLRRIPVNLTCKREKEWEFYGK